MNSITIEDYDPRWASHFQSIRREIAAALDGMFVAIEHVGSTSVPGLAAKPIIDLDVLLKESVDFSDVVQKLEPLGYRYRGNLGIEGREAFETPPQVFAHHLYVCLPGSHEFKRHIAFRDYLRNHPVEAVHYTKLKRELAAKSDGDREEYTRAKSHFVLDILHRAASGN
jgi:GrpB-like predicted nucleotidyltransferase (UPF0157 family)